MCAVEVIKYGLEPTIFVDGLCIAIDLGEDTPKEYIIYALFSFLPTVECSESKAVMEGDVCCTGTEGTGGQERGCTKQCGTKLSSPNRTVIVKIMYSSASLGTSCLVISTMGTESKHYYPAVSC